MTTTTQTTDTGIPDALKRNPDNTLPGSTVAAKVAAPVKADRTPAAPKPVAAKVAAPVKAKADRTPAAKKGKVVDAPHKPSEVKATDANPQKSIVPVKFKERYAQTGDSCGDRVALALKSFTTGINSDGRPCCDVAKLKEVAAANGLDWSAYSKMNVGQQRMNVGNRLRGMVKNEKTVTIGKQRFADWDKAKVVDRTAWAKPEPKAKAVAAA